MTLKVVLNSLGHLHQKIRDSIQGLSGLVGLADESLDAVGVSLGFVGHPCGHRLDNPIEGGNRLR